MGSATGQCRVRTGAVRLGLVRRGLVRVARLGGMSEDYRIEHDSMGEVRVPAAAKWRAQTQRAVQNFPISGLRLERAHIAALARIKAAAARVNAELGVLAPEVADAVAAAA